MSSPTTIYNATISINNQNIPVVSFTFTQSRETELVHVNQPEPIGKVKGKRSYSGEITVLLYDALRIENSAPLKNGQRNIDELEFDIVHVQDFGLLGGISTKVYQNCNITEFSVSASEGDMNMQVTLPVVFTGIISA